MSTLASAKYYVYVLARPDGRPFYVGKGTGDRLKRHEREAKSGCACYRCRIIRKVWRGGEEIARYIMLTTDDEADAFAYEQALISMYDRHTLANQTDGGEGPSGRVVSEMTRARIRAANLIRFRDPAVRAARSAAQRVRFSDPAVREQMRIVQHAVWADPELLTRHTEIIRSIWADPELRRQQSARMRQIYNDPLVRENHRQSLHQAWKDPEKRARRSEQAKLRAVTAEGRAQILTSLERARAAKKNRRSNA